MIPKRYIPWIPPLAVALLTCHYRHQDHEGVAESPGTTRLTSADPANGDVLPKSAFAPPTPRTISNTAAIANIVEARCEREARCGNIGEEPDKTYSDLERCTNQLTSTMRIHSELGDRECPDGVLPNQLEHCLDAISHESCTTKLYSLDNYVACRTQEMCLTGTTTGRPF